MEKIWYWLAFIVYSVAMVCVGVVTRRKRLAAGQSANLEFWIACRQLPGWWLGMSLTAGWLMLGWLSYGMSQVYMYGATGLWILPIPWFILCFIILAIVPFVRRVGAVSLPEAIEKRYGLSARVLLAVFSFFVFIVWTQAELFIAGQLISPFLGLAKHPWIVVAMLITPAIIYMCLGGFRVVVTTDVAQFLMMAVFMVILAAAAIQSASQASGGAIIEALRNATLPSSGAGAALNFGFLGWLFPLVLLAGFLPGWMVEQDLTLRLQAAGTTRNARVGAVTAFVLIIVFVLILPSIVAFCAIVVFPPVSGAPPAEAIGADATKIVSGFIARLPFALSVFMVAGVVACQMSTVDTFTNVSAMPLAYDIIVPVIFRRRISDRGKAAVGRAATLGAFLVAAGLAMINDKLGDVYNISSGVLSASIAVPAIFIFWKRTTLPAVIAAAIVGFAGTVVMYLLEVKAVASWFALPSWLAPSAGYNYVATGVVLSVITIVLVSLLTPRPTAKVLANVKDKPIDDWREFSSSVS